MQNMQIAWKYIQPQLSANYSTTEPVIEGGGKKIIPVFVNCGCCFLRKSVEYAILLEYHFCHLVVNGENTSNIFWMYGQNVL